jgi:hypothetical protein
LGVVALGAYGCLEAMVVDVAQRDELARRVRRGSKRSEEAGGGLDRLARGGVEGDEVLIVAAELVHERFLRNAGPCTTRGG